MDEACRRSEVGKLLPNALYVHRCARFARAAVTGVRGLRPGVPGRGRGGEPDQAAPAFGEGLVPGLSRLRRRPAPGLLRSIKLSLRTRELDCYDYAISQPPLLHRKETFLPPATRSRPKFARLTAQEEKHGLLDDTATIGTRKGWAAGWGTGDSTSAATGWCGGRRRDKNHEATLPGSLQSAIGMRRPSTTESTEITERIPGRRETEMQSDQGWADPRWSSSASPRIRTLSSLSCMTPSIGLHSCLLSVISVLSVVHLFIVASSAILEHCLEDSHGLALETPATLLRSGLCSPFRGFRAFRGSRVPIAESLDP